MGRGGGCEREMLVIVGGRELCGIEERVVRDCPGAMVTTVGRPPTLPDVMTTCCRVCNENRAGIPNGREFIALRKVCF